MADSPASAPTPSTPDSVTVGVTDDIRALGGNGPIIGLDPGTRTIGVAASDRERRVAAAVGTIQRRRFTEDVAELRNIMTARKADAIVVGLPVNMSGTEGPRAQSARAFARNLAQALQCPVALWDERWSTVAAERALEAAGVRRHQQAEIIDGNAAAFILQGALDRIARAAETADHK